MEKPLPAYKGAGKYVFVCYSHEDSDAVLREIAWLNDYGTNVWYDEGISPGAEWTEELASAIQGSTKILYFVTPNSVASEHCRRELNFAQDEGREVVSIHLVPTEVPAGLRLSLNNRQAILRYQLSEEEFHKRLIRVAHSSVAHAADSGTPISHPKKPGTKIRFALFAAVVLFFAAAGVWWTTSRGTTSIATVTEQVSMDEKSSVAVLPFANLSLDPEQEFLAIGVADEVSTRLAQINSLKVISRTSSFSFKGQNVDLATIAERLGVSYLVEGSVRRAGERVRISVQLVDVTRDEQLWSETYEGDLREVFEVQTQIAASVATQLNVTLFDHASMVEDVDPAAYSLFLQARHILGLNGPDESILRAEELLNEALRIEADYVRAILELSRVAVNKYFRGMISIDEGMSQSREGLRRALELDPNDALANGWLGWQYMFFDHDLAAGAPYLERALLLDPLHIDILRPTVFILVLFGRIDDATRLAEHVVQRDPLCVTCLSDLADTYLIQSRLDEAESILRRGLALDPGLIVNLTYLRIRQNRPAEAIELTEQMPDDWYRALLRALAYHDLRNRQEFEEELASLQKGWPERRFDIAVVYAYVGEADKAFANMTEAVERDSEWKRAFYSGVHLFMLGELLRNDPRWAAFVSRHGISQEQIDRIPFDPALPV